MGEPYHAVLLRPEARLDLPLAGAMLAVTKSLDRHQAIRQVRDCGGILADDLTEEQARVLAAGLSAKGMPAVHAPTPKLRPLPEAQPVDEAQVQPEALWVRHTDSRAEVAFEEIPWADVRLVAAARVRFAELVKRPTVERPMYQPPQVWGGRHSVGSASFTIREENVERSNWTFVADLLVTNPWRRYRLVADRFHYFSTGLALDQTSFTNFARLLGAIAGRAQQSRVDPSVRLVLDGNPQTHLDAHSLDHYDRYIRWRLQFLHRSDD